MDARSRHPSRRTNEDPETSPKAAEASRWRRFGTSASELPPKQSSYKRAVVPKEQPRDRTHSPLQDDGYPASWNECLRRMPQSLMGLSRKSFRDWKRSEAIAGRRS